MTVLYIFLLIHKLPYIYTYIHTCTCYVGYKVIPKLCLLLHINSAFSFFCIGPWPPFTGLFPFPKQWLFDLWHDVCDFPIKIKDDNVLFLRGKSFGFYESWTTHSHICIYIYIFFKIKICINYQLWNSFNIKAYFVFDLLFLNSICQTVFEFQDGQFFIL